MSTKDRWTAREEAELNRLLARKNELTEKNMKPLVELARMYLLEGAATAENIAEGLAAEADAFRDALEPFDSGIRCADGVTT